MNALIKTTKCQRRDVAWHGFKRVDALSRAPWHEHAVIQSDCTDVAGSDPGGSAGSQVRPTQ